MVTDVAATNFDQATISVLRRRREFSLQSQVQHAVEEDPFSITTGDLNEDAAVDLLVSNRFSWVLSAAQSIAVIRRTDRTATAE